ncbi:MAG TPA: VTT domain-containing protein [Blastocatellia bacterium]|nr:VTT domain-containing protein [Blastocatellia bacterium]
MLTFQAVFLAGSAAHSIFRFFRGLGAFGLLLLGVLDSSFLFLPFGNDLLLIALVSSHRNSTAWIPYVLMAVLGSILGVFLVDLLMRKAGEEGLRKFVRPGLIKRLRSKIEMHAGWVLFLAPLIPPPFPFTAVVMTASALQYSRWKLLVAVCCGRLVRFTVEALLAIHFGRKLLSYFKSDVLDYLVYGFIAVAAVGSFFTVRKWVRRRGGAPTTRHDEERTGRADREAINSTER